MCVCALPADKWRFRCLLPCCKLFLLCSLYLLHATAFPFCSCCTTVMSLLWSVCRPFFLLDTFVRGAFLTTRTAFVRFLILFALLLVSCLFLLQLFSRSHSVQQAALQRVQSRTNGIVTHKQQQLLKQQHYNTQRNMERATLAAVTATN